MKQGIFPDLPNWLVYADAAARFNAKPWEVTPVPGRPGPHWWVTKAAVLNDIERLIREARAAEAEREKAKRAKRAR